MADIALEIAEPNCSKLLQSFQRSCVKPQTEFFEMQFENQAAEKIVEILEQDICETEPNQLLAEIISMIIIC